MKILNLTPNRATSEQIAQGVVDLDTEQFDELCQLLKVDEVLTQRNIRARINRIAAIANGYSYVMLGGPPCFTTPLDALIRECRQTPLYPVYSESKHVGFIGLKEALEKQLRSIAMIVDICQVPEDQYLKAMRAETLGELQKLP